MARCALVLATLVAAGLGSANPTANAGGTVVRAPESLEAADCAQSAEPRFAGQPPDALVIGCTDLGGGFLLAADHNVRGRPTSDRRGYACYYVAPAGGEGDARCYDARPEPVATPPYPVTGASGVAPLRVMRARGGGVLVIAQAASDVATVIFRYRTGRGRVGKGGADLIGVAPELATRLGSPRPFGFHIAELPSSTRSCAGIEAVAHDSAGARVGRSAFRDREAIPLPGTRRCLELRRERRVEGFVDRAASWMASFVGALRLLVG